MDKNLVSIITPMYNAEKYIVGTIESVLEQSYENWECLFVMNFSHFVGEQLQNTSEENANG